MFPGGNCLNLSVYVRRFGGSAAYVGAIGKDRAGDVILQALLAEGVDVSRLRRIDGPTAYCAIGHRGAERVFLSSDPGVSMFAPAAEDFQYLEAFDAVHIGQSSGLDAYVPEAARRTLLSYDFSTRSDPDHKRCIAPHCFLASISASDLTEANAQSVSIELLEAGARWVLATRGPLGAVLTGPEGRFDVAAEPVEPVDTLGAGDTFVGRTLFGLLKGENPQLVIRAAAGAAARTCLHFGSIGYGAEIDLSGYAERGRPVVLRPAPT
ncbi:MAG: ribokinase [Hyphomicrobiales bacterium]|nr:ribokinase [Hyphomicrobiales bacterium]